MTSLFGLLLRMWHTHLSDFGGKDFCCWWWWLVYFVWGLDSLCSYGWDLKKNNFVDSVIKNKSGKKWRGSLVFRLLLPILKVQTYFIKSQTKLITTFSWASCSRNTKVSTSHLSMRDFLWECRLVCNLSSSQLFQPLESICPVHCTFDIFALCYEHIIISLWFSSSLLPFTLKSHVLFYLKYFHLYKSFPSPLT